MSLLFEQETFRIIGACMNVHKALGAGFLESVYQEALEKEFINLSLPYFRNQKLHVFYNGEKLQKYFIADFVCFDSIIVELKSASFLHPDNHSQTINYLKATGFQVGLLINFGQSSLKWKRFIHSV